MVPGRKNHPAGTPHPRRGNRQPCPGVSALASLILVVTGPESPKMGWDGAGRRRPTDAGGGAAMSGLLARERERSTNPLDMLEQIVTANEWIFERRSSGEMAAEAPGKWCDYGLFFSWSPEISAMHFSCA